MSTERLEERLDRTDGCRPAVTELKVQPLSSGLRKPSDRYRLAAFFAFTPGELEHLVPMPPGWYACAWRQVNRVTGQMTDWSPLGKVEVG